MLGLGITFLYVMVTSKAWWSGMGPGLMYLTLCKC